MQTVCLRYFNVYGPRQDPSSMYSGVISKVTDNVLGNRPVTIFGDGLQTRDFVFVKDVARANLLAMRAPGAGGGDVFNVASGKSVSLLDLLKALGSIENKEIAPCFKEARAGDIRHSSADISRAQSTLGFRPEVSLEQGLKALLDHLKGNKE
jgi:UDP-glucose 4-epimerase